MSNLSNREIFLNQHCKDTFQNKKKSSTAKGNSPTINILVHTSCISTVPVFIDNLLDSVNKFPS